MDGISQDRTFVPTSLGQQSGLHSPPSANSRRFEVVDWAAWAPGLTESTAWLPWPDTIPPVSDELPTLAEMPSMMRRRLDRLGRMALQAAYHCQAGKTPIIFASRYGDLSRSADLLRALAETGTVSPTQFSLSVHNAIAALYGIANSDTSNYSAIAAGAETTEAAFIEAQGLLADGAEEVMIVRYEDRADLLPGFLFNSCRPHAWACRIRATNEAGISLRCRLAQPEDCAQYQTLDFAELHFLITDTPALERRSSNRIWHWQKHA